MLLSLSQWLQSLYPEQLGFLRVLPVPDLSRRAGRDDGLADRPGVRALGHQAADRDEDRPADPRVRRAGAHRQERHADDGRRAGADRHRRVDAVVVRLEQPLRLDRDAGDLRLRRRRLGRRLAQGGAQEPGRHALAREVLLAVADRPGGGLLPVLRGLGKLQPARLPALHALGAERLLDRRCRPMPTCWCPSSRPSATRSACGASSS